LSHVRETGSFDQVFLVPAHLSCIAPKAASAGASSEIAAAIRHFENCKDDSRAASNRLQKRDQVFE